MISEKIFTKYILWIEQIKVLCNLIVQGTLIFYQNKNTARKALDKCLFLGLQWIMHYCGAVGLFAHFFKRLFKLY